MGRECIHQYKKRLWRLYALITSPHLPLELSRMPFFPIELNEQFGQYHSGSVVLWMEELQFRL